ncbi:hypothetical protein PRZ48_009011 [Zasmidium cellare]|uniref:Uncharacterized protein n=1 Tax=Zasmidium cellare TaxID=395010 RepID=A0ABR0EHH8_ZASCE|nr:hypothetical protein PRZ48_009011 [Zasmidium cellare]
MPSPALLASTLRFANGDLLVKLSSDGTLDVLVSTTVITQTCRNLAFVMQLITTPEYTTLLSTSTKDSLPDSNQHVELNTLALKFVDGTLLLEGREFQGAPVDKDCLSFDHSAFAIPDWPEHAFSSTQTGNDANILAACQYLILFKFLHGQDFTLDEFEPWYDTVDEHNINRYLDHISELCARAEYLGCLPQTAKAIASELCSLELFWKTMHQNAFNRMLLGEKLRSKEIYFDAIRHLIASSHGNEQELTPLFDYFNLDPASLRSLFQSMLAKQAQVIKDLLDDLRQLALFKSTSTIRGGSRQTSHTTYTNKIRANNGIMSKTALNVEFIARAHWAQYLAQQETGQHVYDEGFGIKRAIDAGPLCKTFASIEEWANHEHPHLLFGEDTVSILVDAFNLQSDSKDQLVYWLDMIVEEAHDIIQNAFAMKEVIDDDGVKMTWRRAKFDVNEEYWTYLPWDEEDVPWEDEAEWNAAASRSVDFNQTQADHAQLQALGIVPVSEIDTDEIKVDWSTATPALSLHETAVEEVNDDLADLKPFSEW